MFKSVIAVLCLALGLVQGFVQPMPLNTRLAAPRTKANLAMEGTYWEGKSPDSKVLGPVVSKIPSVALAALSVVSLGVGTYCVHESNIFHTLSADNFNGVYIIGAQLVPISWGLHVGSWIQKQNGK